MYVGAIIHAQRRQWGPEKNAHEKRALPRRDFSRISREKSWSRTVEKLRERPRELGSRKMYCFLITSEDFPSLISLSDGSRHISSARSSFLYEQRLSTVPRYSKGFSCTPQLRQIQSSTPREYQQASCLPCSRFMRTADDRHLMAIYSTRERSDRFQERP